MILDPIIQANLEVTEDVWVESTSNKNSYTMFIAAKDGNYAKKRSLVKFNITSIPTSADILTATLNVLYYAHSGPSGSWVDRPVRVYRMTRNWLEAQATSVKATSTVNWTGTLAEGDYNTSHTDELIFKFNTFGWKSFNVQPIVRDWVAQTYINNGLMLKAANEDTYGYDVRMYSSEHATVSNRPYLEVTYRLEYKKAFYMKDHLGNIRVTMDEAGNVIGGNDYYPFGLQMPGRSYVAGNYQNTYKYSGKELDEEQFSNGTTMGAIDWYYFGARYYDPEIGRWYVVDAFSEKAPSWTPYNYTFNNPYKYVDADGNFPFLFIGALALYAVLSAPGPVNAPSPADVENGNLYKAQTNEEFAIEAGLKVAALLTIATATSDATSTPIENADDQPEQPALPDKAEDSKEGPYDRPANRDEQGRPQPDPKAEGPHSTLSTRKGEKQGHTFNEEGQLETEVSPNDKRHGPHQHNYDNSDPKNPARGKVKQIKKE